GLSVKKRESGKKRFRKEGMMEKNEESKVGEMKGGFQIEFDVKRLRFVGLGGLHVVVLKVDAHVRILGGFLRGQGIYGNLTISTVIFYAGKSMHIVVIGHCLLAVKMVLDGMGLTQRAIFCLAFVCITRSWETEQVPAIFASFVIPQPQAIPVDFKDFLFKTSPASLCPINEFSLPIGFKIPMTSQNVEWKRKAECEELQARVEVLSNENHALKDELQRLSEECKKLTSENDSLKICIIVNDSMLLEQGKLTKVCEPEAVPNVDPQLKSQANEGQQ
ncbi:hypothetical protein M8C21_006868, partial [Ambrosia artemisiifolia]